MSKTDTGTSRASVFSLQGPLSAEGRSDHPVADGARVGDEWLEVDR